MFEIVKHVTRLVFATNLTDIYKWFISKIIWFEKARRQTIFTGILQTKNSLTQSLSKKNKYNYQLCCC